MGQFLERREVDVVVDVGANEGQFATELRKAGFSGRIVSLEPLAAEAARLRELAADDDNWQVLRIAAGPQEGTAVLNRSQSSDYSSFRTPNATGLAFDPQIAVVAQEEVDVRRLDGLMELSHAQRPYIKIDTQGFERPVLDGAFELLKRAVGVQLELPLIHVYDGVWSFDEAVAHMKALGFVPAQFHLVSNSFSRPECTLEVDCVFRREDPEERHQ